MRRVWAALRDAFVAPYRALRPPPETAVAYQLAYLCIAVGMAAILFSGWGGTDPVDSALVVVAGGFGVLGGVTCALGQFSGLWFLERGGLFAVWGALIARQIMLARLDAAPPAEVLGRILIVAALGIVLIPRFRSIRGADQDPAR